MTSVSNPIRHPDVGSAQVMTRRAWWLVVLNFLIPGSAQVLAGNRRLGRFGLVSINSGGRACVRVGKLPRLPVVRLLFVCAHGLGRRGRPVV